MRTISAFAHGHRKTKKNLRRGGQLQDLPDPALMVSLPYCRELMCTNALESYAGDCLATGGTMDAELVLSEMLDKERYPWTSTLGVGRGG